MYAKETIKFALTASNGAVLSVIDKMIDAATTFPKPNGGCHPLWVLGHLTMVEGMIPVVLYGDSHPVGEWQRYFGEYSEPVADAGAYPSFAAVREKYLELREEPKASRVAQQGGLGQADQGPTERPRAGICDSRAQFSRANAAPADASQPVTDALRAAGRTAFAIQAASKEAGAVLTVSR
jgi:hypothetical protein